MRSGAVRMSLFSHTASRLSSPSLARSSVSFGIVTIYGHTLLRVLFEHAEASVAAIPALRTNEGCA